MTEQRSVTVGLDDAIVEGERLGALQRKSMALADFRRVCTTMLARTDHGSVNQVSSDLRSLFDRGWLMCLASLSAPVPPDRSDDQDDDGATPDGPPAGTTWRVLVGPDEEVVNADLLMDLEEQEREHDICLARMQGLRRRRLAGESPATEYDDGWTKCLLEFSAELVAISPREPVPATGVPPTAVTPPSASGPPPAPTSLLDSIAQLPFVGEIAWLAFIIGTPLVLARVLHVSVETAWLVFAGLVIVAIYAHERGRNSR